MDTMFRVHPARHPIDRATWTRSCGVETDDLRRFVREPLRAEQHCVVVLAGDVEAAGRSLDKPREVAFARLGAGPGEGPDRETRCRASRARWTGATPRRRHGRPRVSIVRVGFHTIPLSHPDLHALDLFAAVLGHRGGRAVCTGGSSSRTASRTPIQVGSHTPRYGGRGCSTSSRSAPPRTSPKVEKPRCFEEIRRLAEERPTEEELSRAKRLVERDFVLNALQRAADLARARGDRPRRHRQPGTTAIAVPRRGSERSTADAGARPWRGSTSRATTSRSSSSSRSAIRPCSARRAARRRPPRRSRRGTRVVELPITA
jgi:hypothetical protein